MANTKSSIKKIKVSKRRAERNNVYLASAQSSLKQARKAISQKKKEPAQALTDKAIRALDKAASKGVIHKNNAARRKSRLLKRLNAMLEA